MTLLLVNKDEERFLVGLRNCIPMISRQSDEQLRRRIGKEKLSDLASDVMGLIYSSVDQPLNKNEEEALVCQVMSCLSTYIRTNLKLPITLNTLVSNIPLIQEAVDTAFPSYIESKLLKYTITPRNFVSQIDGSLV